MAQAVDDRVDFSEHPSDVALVDALVADLRPDTLERVNDHVKACAACTTRMRELEAQIQQTEATFQRELEKARRQDETAAAGIAASPERPPPEGRLYVLKLRRLKATSLGHVATRLAAGAKSNEVVLRPVPSRSTPRPTTTCSSLETQKFSIRLLEQLAPEGDKSKVILSVQTMGDAAKAPLEPLIARGPDGQRLPGVDARIDDHRRTLEVEGTGEVQLEVRAGTFARNVPLRFERSGDEGEHAS